MYIFVFAFNHKDTNYCYLLRISSDPAASPLPSTPLPSCPITAIAMKASARPSITDLDPTDISLLFTTTGWPLVDLRYHNTHIYGSHCAWCICCPRLHCWRLWMLGCAHSAPRLLWIATEVSNKLTFTLSLSPFVTFQLGQVLCQIYDNISC